VPTPAKSKPKARPADRKPGQKPVAATSKPAPRKDLGAPVDGFFARQPAGLRPIVDQLRAMIAEAAPAATSAIKWGMPFFSVGPNMMCAVAAFKAHVNLILPGPPGTYADPDGRLEGDGKTGKHLKLRAPDEIPHAAIRGWLKTAAARAKTESRRG
jgi:hypothetical protein